jgi:hypothetical protein
MRRKRVGMRLSGALTQWLLSRVEVNAILIE